MAASTQQASARKPLRSSERRGSTPCSSQSRRRSKLHAVAQPRSGRNSKRSATCPSAPNRVWYSYLVRNRTPSSVGTYCQYPEPTRISDLESSDQNRSEEV